MTELFRKIERFYILIGMLVIVLCTLANTYAVVHLVSVHFSLCKFYADFHIRM